MSFELLGGMNTRCCCSKCHCPVGSSPGPHIILPPPGRAAGVWSPFPKCSSSTAIQKQQRSDEELRAPAGHDQASLLPPPPPPPLRRRGVHGGGGGGGRRHGLGGAIGPVGQVRVHGVRPYRFHLEGRDGLGDRCDPPDLRRVGHPDRGPGAVGRADGARPRLLRAWQPRHLQRAWPLHARRALRHEPHLRRHGPAPRVVLQLPRGHRHGAPPRVRAAALHRRAVTRHRRAAVQALLHRRQVRQEAAGEGARGGGCGRAVNRNNRSSGIQLPRPPVPPM